METKDIAIDAVADTVGNALKLIGFGSNEKLPETQDNENNNLTSGNSNSKERIKNGK